MSSRIVDFGVALWHKSAVPIFLERFVLPLFAAAVIILALTNPMGFDNTQRVTGSLALLFAAYFVAHSIYNQNRQPPPQEDRFLAVEIYSDLLVGASKLNEPYLWVAGATNAVTSVDVMLGMQITNLQSMPTQIDEFSVELEANGGWLPLNNIAFDDQEVYIASPNSTFAPLTDAVQVSVFPKDISSLLGEHTLSSGVPVRVTGLFKYSAPITSVPNEIPTFRISLHDAAGHKSVHILTCPVHGFLGATTSDVQLNSLGLIFTGKRRNLAGLRRY